MAAKGNENMYLWWGSGSGPCWRVIFALAEKGLWEGCPNKLIEFSKKEHKADDVLKLNPRGQVPTFKDGDTVINESMAICLYLEEKHGDKGNRLLPADVKKRASVYQRLVEMSNMEGAMRPVFQYFMSTKAEDRDKDKTKELFAKAEEELGRWNDYLTGKKYLCEDQFTMADIFLYTAVAFMDRQGVKLDKYPALKAFLELVGKRDAAAVSRPPHWKDSESPNMLKGLGE